MKLPHLLPALLTLALPAVALAAIEQQNVPKQEKAPEPAPAPVLTKPPELVTFVAAPYPPELAAQGKGGEAVLYIDIAADGTVERALVVSATEPEFGTAAVIAAKQFVFTPAEIDGKPAPIRIEYRYEFVPEMPEPDAIAGAPSVMEAVQAPVNFHGVVREAGTRKPIVGAVVTVDGRPLAETDATGEFSVRGVPPGKLHVRVESRFHETYEVDEEFSDRDRLEVKYYLLRKSNDPFETIVRGRTERREAAKVQLERQEVTKVPGTFGDPVRVIENLPGMARTPGGLGGALLVRGGYPQDTAVYIDGVQVPLLYHFGGLTSVVNAEFLDRIDFFPGGFGARYGRATAGVVDVVSRETSCDLWRGVGEVSLLHSAGYLCAPADTWAVAAAGRRSYIDLFLPFVLDQVPRKEDEGRITASPLYWDYQAKARTKRGSHTFDIFAFGADDKFKLIQTGSAEDLSVDFGMHLMSHRLLLRHRYQPQPGLSITSSLTPGYSLQKIGESSSDLNLDLGIRVGIWTVDWREDLAFKVNDWLTLNGGIDHTIGKANIGLEVPFQSDLRPYPSPVFDYTQTSALDEDMKGFDQGYWVEAVVTPTPSLKLVPGLRIDSFDIYKTQAIAVEPRATTRWEFIKGSTLKAAYGIYEKLPDAQYLMGNNIGNPDLGPERAQHFIVGYEQVLTELINFDLQLFYNLRDNLRSPSSKVTYRDGTAVPEIWNNDGSGHSYGLEILLRHLASADGKFYGWVAYTLSRAVQRDRRGTHGDYGEGEDELHEYLFPFDQTHNLTVVGQWVLPWGFEAGFRFRLVTGSPYTPYEKGTVSFDVDQDRYSLDMSNVERNSARMPRFDQLDIRIDKTFTFDLWKLTTYLELLNSYNASNVEAYQYDYRYRGKAAISILPIVPILGVKGEF